MEYYETLTTYQFKGVKAEYTHIHTQALLKMLNAKNTKQGSDHDVTTGKYNYP